MTKSRILIVEDEVIVAKDLERTVRKLGFDVCACVSSGIKAVDEATKRSPDLVLMDIKLKGEIDGIEAASRIRSKCDIPVVYITAYAEQSLLERAKVTHPYGYILKPFQERELHAIIEISLYKHRADRALQRAHDDLELRVEERTAELARTNERLLEEIEERKRVEEALRKSEQEIRRLYSQLLTVQEAERARVVAELHEGLGQTLSGIKYNLEAIHGNLEAKRSAALAGKAYETVVPALQDSIDQVRRICTHLRPVLLDDLGIVRTIRWYAREFEQASSDVQLELGLDLEENDVPEPLKIVVFRLVQEALSNVAKHSRADRVRLSLTKVDDQVELTVKDDGIGFDVEKALSMESPERGLGLGSMKERARLTGGSFSVESERGAGTTVRASWPSNVASIPS